MPIKLSCGCVVGVTSEEYPEMSALEQELIDRIRKLEENQQRQVLAYIGAIQPEPFDFDQWLQQVENFQLELAAEYGTSHTFGTLDLLDELRQQVS